MRISKGTAGTAVLAALLAVACAREPEQATTEPEQTTPEVVAEEQPGTEAPSDIAPTTAMTRVEDLKVGPQLGTDGAVAENTDNFKPGDKIYVSLAVGDIGVGSQVAAVWKGPEDQQIHTEVQDVQQGSTHLVFEAPDTSAWEPGDYAVEIRLGDEVGGTETFDIEEQAG
jgi:hypothetical protein